nr:AT-hook motif nuclear-localized protein 7-like isoform X2 [Lolium perenne]
MEQATETAAAQPAPETTEATPPAPPPPPPAAAAVVTVATAGRGEGKRKRGRPRKYGVDGGPVRPLKATPISASVPDDSGGGQYTPAASVGAVMKRGRGSGRPVGFVSRAAPVVAVTAATPTAAVVVSTPPPSAAVAQKQQLAPQVVAVVQKQQPAPQLGTASGDVVGCASGANFTPHILNVVAGEDINMKVISFSQQGPRAICILSANGMISNVTLRQHDSLGGTVTYEGRFELLSLSGSFTPTDNGGTRDRSGGMSVSLAAADGRVIGGGVAGLLVAASPVQVVVGSFFPSYQMDQNAKKPVVEMKTRCQHSRHSRPWGSPFPAAATWRTPTAAASSPRAATPRRLSGWRTGPRTPRRRLRRGGRRHHRRRRPKSPSPEVDEGDR